MSGSRSRGALLRWLLCPLVVAGAAASAEEAHWVGAWMAAPDSAGRPLGSQTVRQVVRTSLRGSSVRLRLSNLFGRAPLTIGPVRVARSAGGSGVEPGSDRAVTFGGQPAVTIPKGGEALSDPLAFRVAALEQLAVSLYLPGGAPSPTVHGTALQTAFIAHGDVTAAADLPAAEASSRRFFLTDLEVAAAPNARAFVAFGDSITDGFGSTPDRNRRWPDALAARLQADPALASLAVLNAGISGNRLLGDAAAPFLGPSGLSRFERDALSKPGVRWVLLLAGINDITAADILPGPEDQVSAEDIIGGLQALVARAQARGVAIWGGTLLPCGGLGKPFVGTPAGEAKRQAVNAWIRTSGAFDAVVDFERALRDPGRPDRLLPAFDSGNHLNPNDDGYDAMAAAIDLARLIRGK